MLMYMYYEHLLPFTCRYADDSASPTALVTRTVYRAVSSENVSSIINEATLFSSLVS